VGGRARRQSPTSLTTSPAEESNPHFSPDGSLIAFAANYENNTSVYVDSGQKVVSHVRLTWHPADDIPVGWSADGGAVAFASRRETDHGRSAQLYHVPVNGGAADQADGGALFPRSDGTTRVSAWPISTSVRPITVSMAVVPAGAVTAVAPPLRFASSSPPPTRLR
jgi:Tol biopolymer transport system component